jgi:hypothetical protein
MVAVGVGSNGRAYNPGRNLLLAVSVGDSEQLGSYTVWQWREKLRSQR